MGFFSPGFVMVCSGAALPARICHSRMPMPFSRGTLLISVRMFAGSMQLQRMPRSKNEAEMLRVRPSTACLVVTYIAPPFRPRRDAAEATLTMFAGVPCSRKILIARWQHRNTARWLVS